MSGSTTPSDLVAYRQQVYNFLQSLTLKFAPFETAYNNYVLSLGGTVNEEDPTTWKYYLNMQGQYHPVDEMMTVASLDTQQTINFTQEILPAHPRTQAAYVPGTPYWDALCSRYPAQVDLLKSIVYPVTDINSAIQADDLTILAYGANFLESTEFTYLYTQLQNFLIYQQQRWNFDFLNYEPYYYWVRWGMLWQLMVGTLFTARVTAIKTTNVHSWHIWQYLIGKGLSDYSDILSREPSLFLYRNIDYINVNRGKQSTLIQLADNILSSIGVGLYGRDVYQQTQDGASECQLVPELVASIIGTNLADVAEPIPPSSISDMNLRLIEAGDETNNDADYVASISQTLGTTTYNTYPTKLMEIRPLSRDRTYSEFFNNFVLDNLVYAVQNNYYTTQLEYTEPLNQTVVTMTPKEALVLLYYALTYVNYTPAAELPTRYSFTCAINPTPGPVPPSIVFNGVTYYTQMWVNLAAYTNIPSYPTQFLGPTDFSNQISQFFLTMLYQIVSMRLSSLLPQTAAMVAVTESMLVNTVNPLNLIPGVTYYQDWLTNYRPDINANIIQLYNASTNAIGNYNNLINTILSNLIPVTPVMAQYGNFLITDQNYARLKQLFVQLCSYNVTFLDTDRDDSAFLPLYDSGMVVSATLNTEHVPIRPPGIDQEQLTLSYAIAVADTAYDISFDPQVAFTNTLLRSDLWTPSCVTSTSIPIQDQSSMSLIASTVGTTNQTFIGSSVDLWVNP